MVKQQHATTATPPVSCAGLLVVKASFFKLTPCVHFHSHSLLILYSFSLLITTQTKLELLKVPETATSEQIREAYKREALRTHPDRTTNLGGPDGERPLKKDEATYLFQQVAGTRQASFLYLFLASCLECNGEMHV
jgi:hypothetical protein